ncbi:MAG: 2-hydroxyacid dehydrogenase [Janthinobacterium lividum]
MRPALLILVPMADSGLATLSDAFDIVHAPTQGRLEQALSAHGQFIRLVLTNGARGIDAATMARLPALEMIGALGVGYENIALDAARARGIKLSNGAGTNDDCVADHALALLLAVVRQIPRLDRLTRDGIWRDALSYLPNFSGKKLGILGLGSIGRKVAKRGAGFDLEIGYHNRRPLADSPYPYFDSLIGLASWADYLLVATPGGAGTHHLVDAGVIEALGAQGYLVNVARGSVVDTTALADALERGALGGAGLDVYESEPKPPARLIDSERVVLTPHVAGWSPQAMAASVGLFVANARRHLAGEDLLTPIPAAAVG